MEGKLSPLGVSIDRRCFSRPHCREDIAFCAPPLFSSYSTIEFGSLNLESGRCDIAAALCTWTKLDTSATTVKDKICPIHGLSRLLPISGCCIYSGLPFRPPTRLQLPAIFCNLRSPNMLIEGEKYACHACVRGHRVSNCRHADRPLLHINKKVFPPKISMSCPNDSRTGPPHLTLYTLSNYTQVSQEKCSLRL